jgi:hypothetical protein
MTIGGLDERAQDARASSFGARQPAQLGARAATLDHSGAAPAGAVRDASTTWRSATGRLATWRSPAWPLFLIGFALFGLGLLIGPRVPAADAKYNCVGNVQLEGPFGFALNCDSPEFMWLARDPSALLDHANSRQSRPGLILLAALIQAPLSLTIAPDGPPTPVSQGLYEPLRVAQTFSQDQPAYFAYILLNVAILLASFHVLRLTIERGAPAHSGAAAIIVAATGLLLVANDVTKAFLWSPHTQMFNILVPVMAVYATQRVVADARVERKFALAMGLLVGLGMTAYPVFAVIPICVLLPAVIGLLRERSHAARRRDAASLALLGILSAVPWALWYVYVRITTDGFFAAELHLRQVVWMKDALADGLGAFFSQWFDYLGQLLQLAAPQAVSLAALVGWLALTLAATVRQRIELAAASRIIAIGVYVSCAVLGFYTCVGWIVERLAYPAIPPLIVAAGAIAAMIAQRLAPRPRTIFAAGCLALAVAQVIYEVAKQGPWS